MPGHPLPDDALAAFAEAYRTAVAEGYQPRGETVGTNRRAAATVAGERLGLTANQQRGRLAALDMKQKGWAATEQPAPFVVAPLPSGEEPIEDLIARRANAYTRRHEAKEARELVPVQINIEGAYGILHMGDPHVDDDGCDWPTLLRHLELIDQTEGLFAANVGDLSNNWVGHLARLYASQGTTAAEAIRMVEWFVGRVRWLYLIGGNHDCWSGAADPVKWFASQAGAAYQWHGMRLALRSPNGCEVRVNARHDFAGTSQWNGAHAPAKAARMGWARDHIYTCGHRHMAAHNTLFMNNGEHVAHAIRLGAYKVHDDFADSKGFPKENVPAAVTVVNPNSRDALGRVTVFWDVEAAADFLRYLRKPRVRVAAGRPA
ncbi:metallophosphoesterase [Falsiroseomonas tokyonensis]|uniref:Metallophosphoesterase n=1 Tax=Falsiroseomonas tokyonensis TaxID=430521 RepID=A0ABV7C0L1_9PROT|nr:metallophosphoesterase [Falsiroseomonas tokyonensis]MBU8540798.1 metallophosphoesterase [Falsiroseomonas tokyonensis]